MSDLSYDGNVRADRVQLVGLTGTPYEATGGGGGGGGDASAANQTSQLAQETLSAAALGAPGDTAVTTNATGTISAKLRGVVAHLVSILAKIPAFGTAGTASADVITVQGIASGTAQAISGTVTANAGTGTLAVSGPVTDAQLRATPVPVSGTVTVTDGSGPMTVDGTVAATQSGTWTVQPGNTANTTAWKVDGSAVTQPVSGTVSTTPPAYTAPVSGELIGVTSATVMPTVACKLIRFKASAANAGKVYIGVSGVTKADGATDTTTGLQLSPGEDTGWIPVDNANRFFRICDNTTDNLTYLALA